MLPYKSFDRTPWRAIRHHSRPRKHLSSTEQVSVNFSSDTTGHLENTKDSRLKQGVRRLLSFLDCWKWLQRISLPMQSLLWKATQRNPTENPRMIWRNDENISLRLILRLWRSTIVAKSENSEVQQEHKQPAAKNEKVKHTCMHQAIRTTSAIPIALWDTRESEDGRKCYGRPRSPWSNLCLGVKRSSRLCEYKRHLENVAQKTVWFI